MDRHHQCQICSVEHYMSGAYMGSLRTKEWGFEVPLLIAGMIWGSSFISGKIGVEHVDPVLFSFLRYGFATLSVIPIILLFKEFDRSVLLNPIIIFISVINAVAMNLQNIGMTMTTATNSVLLIDINVVYIAVLAVFLLKERMTRQVMVGLVCGIIGVVIISTNGDIGSLGGGTFLGNLFVLLAGLLWSVYVIGVRLSRRHHPDHHRDHTDDIVQSARLFGGLDRLGNGRVYGSILHHDRVHSLQLWIERTGRYDVLCHPFDRDSVRNGVRVLFIERGTYDGDMDRRGVHPPGRYNHLDQMGQR
jgi:uncharacterized membrane protein